VARQPSERVPTIHAPEYRRILDLLRQARKEARVSQGDVAKRMGYQRQAISKLERGELRLDLLQLRQYLQAIGVPLVTFIERVEAALAKQSGE
jgi:transcriptional regulator with XRE-family HTH domain